MPRVPIPSVAYQPGNSQIVSAPQVRPAENYTGEQLAQFGQGLQRLGGAVNRLEDQAQERIDRAQVKEAEALLLESNRKKLTEFTSLAGKAATEQRQSALEGLDENYKAAQGLLKNDRQRFLFDQSSKLHQVASRGEVEDHTAKAAKAYDIGQSQSLAEQLGMQALASAKAGRGEESDVYRQQMLGEVDHLAELRGLPPAQRDLLRTQATTQLHAGVIAGVIDQDPQKARSYYEQHKAEIEPQEASKIEATLQHADVQDKAASLAYQLRRDFPTQAQREAALQQMFEQKGGEQAGGVSVPVPKIDAKVLRATREWLDSLGAEDSRNEAKAALAVRDQAVQWLTANKTAGLDQMPPSLLRQVAEHPGVREHLTQFVEQGHQFVTTWEGFVRSQSMTDDQVQSMSREELLRNFAFQLDRGDMEKLLKRKDGTADGQTKMEEEQIKVSALNAGIQLFEDRDKTVKKEAEERFLRYRLAAREAQKLNPEKPLADILKQMESVRNGGPAGVPLSALRPEEKPTAAVQSQSGRVIPIADMVDDAGKPAVPAIMARIKAMNAERAAAGKALIPEDLNGVATVWEAEKQSRDESDVSAMRQRLESAGVLRRGTFTGYNYVSVVDAARMLGLTEQEVVERVGRNHWWNLPYNVPDGFDSVPVVNIEEMAKLQRELGKK